MVSANPRSIYHREGSLDTVYSRRGEGTGGKEHLDGFRKNFNVIGIFVVVK
jgi:hypothetical protein